MKGILYLFFFCLLATSTLTFAGASPLGSWQAPFDTTGVVPQKSKSVLTLGDVINLVAKDNPTLQALAFQNKASLGRLKQAGLWPNPGFETEFEEIGWDAPGFKESEITVSLSQDFELFGQRSARKKLAKAEINATGLQTTISAYDLYLETKRRFYNLVYAQQRLELSEASLKLANDIVKNIRIRIGKGVALQSELLLAELENQKAQLIFDQARQEVLTSKMSLTALWKGESIDISVSGESEPNLKKVLQRVEYLETKVDSSRGVLLLNHESAMLKAEKTLAIKEGRPTVTLSGGYKRLQGSKTNSLLFGVSLPLPLFNSNQGTRKSLEAKLRSLDYQIEQERLEVSAAIKSNVSILHQLINSHSALDSLLLPTAEKAYETLQRAYEAGRVPYTQLLEAERSLNELRIEHNNMLLEIHELIIALEGLTGITMRIDEE